MTAIEQFDILMVLPYRQGGRGNVVTATRLRDGLTARGHRIAVFSPEAEPDELPTDGIRLPESAGSVLPSAPAASLERPDTSVRMVHGFHGRHFGRAVARYPELTQRPVLLTATGTDLSADLDGPDGLVVLSAFRAADRLVVFHDEFRSLLERLLPDRAGRIRVIPQGVELPTVPPLPRAVFGMGEEEVAFVMSGSIRPIKRIDQVLDVFDTLCPENPSLRFVVAGVTADPDYAAGLQHRMASRPWAFWAGELPHEEMAGLMGAMDVAINFSLAEGQPQGALEAVWTGKAAVLARVPGNRGLLAEGEECLYVDTKEDLAAAIHQLAADGALRRRLGQAGAVAVRNRFPVDREIDAYDEIYRDLMGLAIPI